MKISDVTAPSTNSASIPPAVPRKWRSHYQTLLRLRDAHLEQKRQLLDAQRRGDETRTDPVDAAVEETEGAERLGALAFEQDALAEVEAALQRLITGTYGICEATGRRIPSARLRAIPWARFTAEAERAHKAQKSKS